MVIYIAQTRTVVGGERLLYSHAGLEKLDTLRLPRSQPLLLI